MARHGNLAVGMAVLGEVAMMAEGLLEVAEEREAHQAVVEGAVVAQMRLAQVEQGPEAR